MSVQSLYPAVPEPPHDPTWWLLDTRAGWHEAELSNVEEAQATRALALTPLPESLRSLTEPSGSFGGLKTPHNVAFGPDGSIFLLDQQTGELKRFDQCECRFKTVPCFGGAGSGPRQLSDPRGIGICRGNLFVCDKGNHRLSVFTLHGFVLRGTWMPPAAELVNQWEPYAIAFDSQGRVFVSDGANGCIHRFHPSGRWQKCLPGFGSVKDIAIDCLDRLYVVIEGIEGGVRVVNVEGHATGNATRTDELLPRFPPLPFAVDAEGRLDLCELCAATAPVSNCCVAESAQPSDCIFDLRGNPVPASTKQSPPLYAKKGTYVSAELDSKLYRCQWHRVVLRGQLPSGTSIRVLTYTAETLQTKDYIQSLADDAWATNQTARQLEDGLWDCLITSDGGRYLWLRLELRGSGFATPLIESLRIEFPRISLRRYLPAVFGEDAGGANFTDRFVSIFDTTLRSIEKEIDEEARYFDPLSTPVEPDPQTGIDFLTWLGSWIGLTIDRHLTPDKRRQVLKRAARLYHIRSTREGLRRQLLFYLGMESDACCCADARASQSCSPSPANCVRAEKPSCAWQPPPLILEHYQLRRWLFLGSGRLGEQAVLWGNRIVNRSQLDEGAQVGQTQLHTTQDPFRDPFHVYAHKFSVFVPARYRQSDRLQKGLENLLNAERPAHTQFQLVYVEPRFRIGFQSMIGLDSVVGRYPTAGVTLNETPLGQASVLSAAPENRGAPVFEVGHQSRVGTTTKLE